MEESVALVGDDVTLKAALPRLTAFADVVGYKTAFLSRMLVRLRQEELGFSPTDERGMQVLAMCLRVGCPPEAVPYFYPKQFLTRNEARALCDAKLPPSVVLRAGNKSVAMVAEILHDKERAAELYSELRRSAQSRLDQLALVLTVKHRLLGARKTFVQGLWEVLKRAYADSIRLYDSNSVDTDFTVEANRILNECLDQLRDAVGAGDDDDEPEGPFVRMVITDRRSRLEADNDELQPVVYGVVGPDMIALEFQGGLVTPKLEDTSSDETIGPNIRASGTAIVFLPFLLHQTGKSAPQIVDTFPTLQKYFDSIPKMRKIVIPVVFPWAPAVPDVLTTLNGPLQFALQQGGVERWALATTGFVGTVVSVVVRHFAEPTMVLEMLYGKTVGVSAENPPLIGIQELCDYLFARSADIPEAIRGILFSHSEVI